MRSGPCSHSSSGPNEQLVFEDEFTDFNFSVWKHEITMSGSGNWEFEMYVNNRSVSNVRNGSLVITPRLTNETLGNAGLSTADVNIWGGDPSSYCTENEFYGCEREGGAGGNIINPIQSARLRTAESFAFKYGRVEVVAKLPRGDWLWPAFWLMPVASRYGGWPASGEIDIFESKGNARGSPGGGCEKFGSTLHWGPFWPENAYLKTHQEFSLPAGDLSQAFHTYGLLWNASRIQTYIDQQIVLDVAVNQSFWDRGAFGNVDNPWEGRGDNAPFDQRFYLIVNLAVGGTNGFFPDGLGDGKPWANTAPHAANDFWAAVDTQWGPTWTDPSLVVDSVRVWQKAADGGDHAYRLML